MVAAPGNQDHRVFQGGKTTRSYDVLSYTARYNTLYKANLQGILYSQNILETPHLFGVQARMVEHDHTTMLYIMFIPLYRTVAVFTKTSPVRSVWSMSRYGTKPSVVHIVFHADMIRHILFMYFFTELFISLCTFLQKYFSVLFIILKDTLLNHML